jgi:hypothetical protein
VQLTLKRQRPGGETRNAQKHRVGGTYAGLGISPTASCPGKRHPCGNALLRLFAPRGLSAFQVERVALLPDIELPRKIKKEMLQHYKAFVAFIAKVHKVVIQRLQPLPHRRTLVNE